MNPKEKANIICGNFQRELLEAGFKISKPLISKCALICVDEIIKQGKNDMDEFNDSYWHQVKKEINRL